MLLKSQRENQLYNTVVLGGVVFSTIAALTVLPVLISRIAE
jgi:multidrug efflux pump subunit AcrB